MPVLLDDPCQGVILEGDPVFYYSGDTVEWVSPDPANTVEAGIGWSRPRSLAKAAYRSGRADAATLGTPPVAPAELGTTWVAWFSTTDTPQFFGNPLGLTFLGQTGYLFAYGIGIESAETFEIAEFSAGNLDGWAQGGAAPAPFVYDDGGTYYLQTSMNGPTQWVTKTVTGLKPSTVYSLRMVVRNAWTPDATVQAQVGANLGGVVTVPANNSLVVIQGVIGTSSAGGTLTVRLNRTNTGSGGYGPDIVEASLRDLSHGVLYWNADSFGTSLGHVKGSTVINDGEQYLIAAVKSRTASDESLVTLYVNGVAEASSIVSNLQADGPLFQGAAGDFSFGNVGVGNWAHIGIYNRALTDLEIAAIYAAGSLDEVYRPSRYVFNGLLWAPMISPKTYVDVPPLQPEDPLLKVWYGTEWYPDFPTPGLVNKTFGLRWSVEGLINATKSLRWSVADANPLPASPQRRNATDSESWRSSDGWKDGYVYQGEYSTNGNYRGVWTLGTTNPFPELRGKNYVVTSATVRMRRTTTGGDGGNSAVYCGTHQYTGNITGTPTISNAQNVGTLAWGGETKEMPIPISWAEDLIEGRIRGFGLYCSTGSPYLRTEGTENYALDGRVTIYFKAA